MNKPIDAFLARGARAARAYRWPGNVRELENASSGRWRSSPSAASNCRRCRTTLRDGRPATSRPDGEPIAEAGDGFNLERHLQDIERSHLERALERAGGVQTRAADVLGLSFRQFRYLMKKHGIKRE